MKKNFSKSSFLAGVLASTLVLSLAAPVLASELKTAELFFNDIKIRLNGKQLALADANGTAVEPFVIDGTTYLPVRAIGEALGLNVGWDGATSTVVLGNDVEMDQPAMWLGEMDIFQGDAEEQIVAYDGVYNSYFTANDSSTYDRYWYPTEDCDFSSTYLLKGQYSTFTGTFYLNEERKNGAYFTVNSFNDTAHFQVFLDDVLAYTSCDMEPGTLPDEFSIDVSDAYKMEIVYTPMDQRSPSYWSFPNCTPIANAALWS